MRESTPGPSKLGPYDRNVIAPIHQLTIHRLTNSLIHQLTNSRRALHLHVSHDPGIALERLLDA